MARSGDALAAGMTAPFLQLNIVLKCAVMLPIIAKQIYDGKYAFPWGPLDYRKPSTYLDFWKTHSFVEVTSNNTWGGPITKQMAQLSKMSYNSYQKQLDMVH